MGAIAYNVSHVWDVAPSPTRARGQRCGLRGAPQRRVARGALLGADAHTCCYAPLLHIYINGLNAQYYKELAREHNG